MNVQEEVDLRIMDPERIEEGRRGAELLFRLHQTMPMTYEYREILKDLFGEIGENSYVSTPISSIACPSGVHIGKNVYIVGVREGSIIAAVAVGNIIKLYEKIYTRLTDTKLTIHEQKLGKEMR